MKKLIFIFSITILAILASCNDSNQGVLQSAHNATAEERPISSYLGFSDGMIYVIRDGDLFSASTNGSGTVEYTKILEVTYQTESTETANHDFPFLVYDKYVYIASNAPETTSSDNESSSSDEHQDSTPYKFYRVLITNIKNIDGKAPRPSDIDSQYKDEFTIKGDSITTDEPIVEFYSSNIATGKVQILYKVKGEERNGTSPNRLLRHYGVIDWSNFTSPGDLTEVNLSNHATVPTNAIIIGDGVLKATTDDPEIEDFEDDLNDLYIWRNNKMYTVRTGTTYSNFPLGSDGAYALLADGKIYSINYNYSEGKYNATLTNNDAFTFDVYKREGNYVPFFRDEGYMYDETGAPIGTQKHHIVGYISGNGIYWVKDFTDETLSDQSEAIPKLLGISNDNDIIPIAFIGTDERIIDGEPHPEYLIVTQNNGFYVLQPTQGDNNRGKMTKVEADAGYSFSQFEFIE